MIHRFALLAVCFTALCSVTAELLMDYVFSQQGCKAAQWDFEDGITFTRMPNATSCVHDDDNGFEYVQVGAYVLRNTSIDKANALVSNPITDQFNSMIDENTTVAIHGNWTIGIWFTIHGEWDIHYRIPSDPLSLMDKFLYEIGSDIADRSVVGLSIRTGYQNGRFTVPYFPLRVIQDSGVDGISVFQSPFILYNMTIVDKTYAMLVTAKRNQTDRITKLTFYLYDVNGTTREWSQEFKSSERSLGTNMVKWNATTGSQFRMLGYRDGAFDIDDYMDDTTDTSIQRFSIWNHYMEEDEMDAIALSHMPNSVPSAKNASFNVLFGGETDINLNTTDATMDYENDAITSFRLLSLPAFGTVMYNGDVIEESDLPYDFVGNLTYEAGDELQWSYPDCSLITFQFAVSDNDQDFSVADSFVHVCIVEVNFPPDVTPVTIQLPRGSSHTFQIEATDLNDDFSPPSFDYGLLNATSDVQAYRNTSKVSFLSVEGTLGSIYLEDCETEIEPDQQFPLETIFCYLSSNGDGSQGLDEFEVVVYDAVSSSDPGTIQFNNTNPLVATTTSITVDEHPTVGSFRLGIFDGLDREESIVGQVLSLPLNGTLRHQQNGSVVNIGDLVDGNLTYTGKEYYFNEFSSGRRENFYGEALPDLDTFTYQVKETTAGATSDIATVSVHVVNVFTPVVSVSGLNSEIEVLAGAPYVLGSLVQIQDKDNEEYCPGVLISTIDGRISFDINQSHLVIIGPMQNNLTLGPCGSRMDDGCDEDLWFSARPRYLNFLLSKMIFQAHKDKTLASSISIRVFKPEPGGITADNFAHTFSQTVPQITGKVLVNVNGTLTDSPTKSPTSSIPTKSPTYAPTRGPDDQRTVIASIVIASVALFLSLIALIVMCVASGGPNKMCARTANGNPPKTKTDGGADFDQEQMSLLGTSVYRPNDDRRVRLRRANPF